MLALVAALAVAQTFSRGMDLSYHGHGLYVPVKDGRVYVEATGLGGSVEPTKNGQVYFEATGRGPVVMVIAGGPGASHSSYHAYFEALARDHTLVLFDNIGRGRSSRLKNPAGYTVERDAEDIEAIRRYLRVDKISLIGHSYGGMPAIAYALKYGPHLSHLVLSDSFPSAASYQQCIDSCNQNVRSQHPGTWAQLMKFRQGGVTSGSPQYRAIFNPVTNPLYLHHLENGRRMFQSADPRDAFNMTVLFTMVGKDPNWRVTGTMAHFDPRPKLKNVKVPTLICVGRYDHVATPRIAAETLALFPKASSRMVVFENSGHRPWLEESSLYFSIVDRFLNR